MFVVTKIVRCNCTTLTLQFLFLSRVHNLRSCRLLRSSLYLRLSSAPALLLLPHLPLHAPALLWGRPALLWGRPALLWGQPALQHHRAGAHLWDQQRLLWLQPDRAAPVEDLLP